MYLLDGKTCVEKQRTRITRRTLDPLIQQTLLFKENSRGKILQVNRQSSVRSTECLFFLLDQCLG